MMLGPNDVKMSVELNSPYDFPLPTGEGRCGHWLGHLSIALTSFLSRWERVAYPVSRQPDRNLPSPVPPRTFGAYAAFAKLCAL
jgi:hypothetical protein